MTKKTFNSIITLDKVKKIIINKRDSFINNKIEKYKEDYLVKYNREAKDIEIKRFRKDIVMLWGLSLYIPTLLLLFLIFHSISEGGL